MWGQKDPAKERYEAGKRRDEAERKDPLLRCERLFREITDEFEKTRAAFNELHDDQDNEDTRQALMDEFVILSDLDIMLNDKPDADRRNPNADRINTLLHRGYEAEAFLNDLRGHKDAIMAILGIPKSHTVIGQPFYNPALYDQNRPLWDYLTRLTMLKEAVDAFVKAYRANVPRGPQDPNEPPPRKTTWS